MTRSWIATLVLSCCVVSSLTAQDVLIANGNVIDVRTGSTAVASILVRDGVITEIAPSMAAESELQVVDASGKWIVPGLVEMHSHTLDEEGLRRTLALGVTSTLNIFTSVEPIPVQEHFHRPTVPTARPHFVTGRFSGGFPTLERARELRMSAPTSVDEVRAILDSLSDVGTTDLKIWIDDYSFQSDALVPMLGDEVVAAIIRGAQARGIQVNIHAMDADLYMRAVRLGADRMIHGTFSRLLTDAEVQEIREAGVVWIPTITRIAAHGDRRITAARLLSDDRLVRTIPEAMVRREEELRDMADNPGLAIRPIMVARHREYLATVTQNTRLMIEQGVPVAIGSDLGEGGYGAHYEIELFRDAGFDPITILRAATLGGAQALGNEERFGTIEVDKVADLVILDANPLEEITNLRAVASVVKGGHVWSPETLLDDDMSR